MEIRNDSFEAQPAKRIADFTRPNREAIKRGTPGIEDIRAQQARAKAEHAARMEAAEGKELAQRIDAARTVHAQRLSGARRADDATQPAADTVEIAPDAVEAERADLARTATEELEAERASGARDQLSLQTERAEAARALLAERAGAARDKLSLSDTSLRLRADAEPADGSARAERVAELKALFQQGRLNTDELVARASYHLLSGE